MTTSNQSLSADARSDSATSQWKLAFASIGVIFGDIGTSPLYAMREALNAVVADPAVNLREAVLGIASLFIWVLILIVTIKYVILLMRADNKGEGGILSLVVLVEHVLKHRGGIVLWIGVIGAAFFFGDAMLTPAISVVSAVEGMSVINSSFAPFVVPISIAVLVALFLFQYHGTAGVASLFAPVTMVWFIALAIMGVAHIADHVEILLAINPTYGIRLLVAEPRLALFILGGVFLAITGGEALYADLGHFGRRPIHLAWHLIVLPALLLNYLGQGAFIYTTPEAISNPFYLMAPSWGLVPLVILATLTTIIASQAVITGAFSMAQQAIAIGLIPRMNITHTSESESGQIYVPQINWMLLIGVTLLVLIFESSSNLAGAYGIAVNVTMLMTAVLAVIFFLKTRTLPLYLVMPLLALIIFVECAFLISNSLKIANGGYMPILIAAVIFVTMRTWVRGRQLIAERLRRESVELKGLLETLERRPPTRVAGTAVFLQTDPVYAPSALMHNLKHNRVLHDILVFITIETTDEPRVYSSDRVTVEKLPLGAFVVEARFGYMEQPDVPSALRRCEPYGLAIDPQQASYFMGRRAILTSRRAAMPLWQQRFFIMLANQSARAAGFFRIPPQRVVELGMQISV
jgi:KUP system potassium uptake protein